MRTICATCKGDNILQDAYVDMNGEVVSTFDNFFCGDCDGECSIETVESTDTQTN